MTRKDKVLCCLSAVALIVLLVAGAQAMLEAVVR